MNSWLHSSISSSNTFGIQPKLLNPASELWRTQLGYPSGHMEITQVLNDTLLLREVLRVWNLENSIHISGQILLFVKWRWWKVFSIKMKKMIHIKVTQELFCENLGRHYQRGNIWTGFEKNVRASTRKQSGNEHSRPKKIYETVERKEKVWHIRNVRNECTQLLNATNS